MLEILVSLVFFVIGVAAFLRGRHIKSRIPRCKKCKAATVLQVTGALLALVGAGMVAVRLAFPQYQIWLGFYMFAPLLVVVGFIGMVSVRCIYLTRDQFPEEREQDMKQGFTLIELMIVVAIIAIVAAIAIPNILSARLRGDETAAINTLREIAAAEKAFKEKAIVDQDGDGIGEYGLLGELSGYAVPRRKDSTEPINQKLLDREFATEGNGFVWKNGYLFQVFLAKDSKGAAGNDADLGGRSNSPGEVLNDAAAVDIQERAWCAYAWPIDQGRTGVRAFFINEKGVVLQTVPEAILYNGTLTVPSADAAYKGLVFQSEAGGTANDKNEWSAVAQ